MGLRSIQSPIALFFLILPAAAPLLSAAGLGGRRGPLDGGWAPIKDIKDPYVKEIAGFAVSEYNKKSGASLALVDVTSGYKQVVAGMNYRLVINASDGKAAGDYEAVVYDKRWEHYRNLTSFKPVKH